MKRWSVCCILWWMSLPLFTSAETLKLCADARYWYPFTYEESSQVKGMHVDIVRHALDNLGYEFEITPYPRRRCILNVQRGKIDGMISVAFDPELAQSFDYPPQAEDAQESAWRIMQVDHVVITPVNDDYEFEGDIRSLPEPVRIPAGETITETLRKAKLTVLEVQTDQQNFHMLVRDKTGTLITTSIIAEVMNENPKYQGKFTIHSTPLASQSYYLAFSKQARLSQESKKRIWQEIAKWRDDYVYMLQLFAQY